MVTNAYFEKVTKFAESDIPMPIRKTENSAGYDFVVAEDGGFNPVCNLDKRSSGRRRITSIYT